MEVVFICDLVPSAHIQPRSKIKIINFENNECINYSLILLKGELDSKSNCCQHQQSLKVLIENKQRVKRLSTKLVNRKFKCLINLNIGNNTLLLSSCCSTVTLTIKYVIRDSSYTVLPIYIVCNGDIENGHFQAPDSEDSSSESALKRINVVGKLIQCLIAEKLFELGYGRKTFTLEDCDIFYSRLNVAQTRSMKPEDLWKNIGREILRSHLGSKTRKYFGFLSSTKYNGSLFDENVKFTHEYVISLTEGYVALGGAQLALFGSACLYTWPKEIEEVEERFTNNTIIDRKLFMDDSCYRGTWGACFSTTMGSVLHELGHTFDLGHTEKGIMSRGFDNIQKVFLLSNEVDQNGKCVESGFTRMDTFYSSNSCYNDDIYFTKSNGAILSYHKWFNSYLPPKRDFSIKYDSISNIIRCTAGLRVVELRHRPSELVLYDWSFPGKVLKYMFQIPKDSLMKLKHKNILLVVEDSMGNILKEEVFIA